MLPRPAVFHPPSSRITPRRLRRGIARLAALGILSGPVFAADGIWTNATTNSTWGTAGNWSGAVANGVDAVADFSSLDLTAARTVNLGANWTVGTLKFGDTVASHNWNLANGTGGPWTLTLATSTAAAPVIHVTSQTTNISAALAGTQGFTKTGTGTAVLTGANTLTGGIGIAEGTLSFASNALNGNLVTFTGTAGTLAWNGTNTQDVSALLKINDGATAIFNVSGTNVVTLSQALGLGPVGTGAVTKTGAGTLLLTGENTYTGGTRVNVGRLVLAGGNNRLLATGAVIFGQGMNSGVLQLGEAALGATQQTVGSVAVAGMGTANAIVGGAAAVSTLTINNAAAVTFNGFLGGAGENENHLALTKTGAGTLTLGNGANTFNGGVNLNQGTLAFATGALAGNQITFAGNSTLQWGTANTQDVSARLKINDGVTAVLDTNGNTIAAATAFQTGPLGTGALTKTGAGTLLVSAANTYTGTTRVNNGRIVLSGGANRLSSATAVVLGLNANSGILQLGDATGPADQTVRSLTVGGNAASLSNAVVGGHATISTLTINHATNVTFNQSLGGAGANENNLALVKDGTGTLTLGGNSSFSGDVEIRAGTLAVTSSAALGAGTKTVSVIGAGSLRLNGTAADLSLPAGVSLLTSNDDQLVPAVVNAAGQNVIAGNLRLASGGAGTGQTRLLVSGGSLTLNGSIAPATQALAARQLILDGAGQGTINGTIANEGTVTLSLVKAGTGTWSLTGANAYTGPTAIHGGRLNITTAQSGGGVLTLADGATLGVTLAAAGQTLNAAGLSLGSAAGSTLVLDFSAFGNPPSALLEAGAFSTAGTSTIHISGTGLSVGVFDLIGYTGTIGGSGFGGLALGSLPARVTANLVDAAAESKVRLNISAFDVPKWTGAAGDAWDVNDGADPTTGTGAVNWREANSGSVTRYLQTGSTVDSVLFDDTATGTTTVNLTTALRPTSVTVNNSSRTYTFTGSGRLTGATALIKQGPGRLIVANSGGNDNTGTTTIAGGTLQVGDGVAPATGHLGSGHIVNQGALVFQRPDELTVANAISGSGSLTQQGGGTLILTGNNAAFDGSIVVAAGILRAGGAGALGSTTGGITVQSGGALELTGQTVAKSIQLTGGTLRAFSGTTNALEGAVAISGGGILDSAAGTTLTVSAGITGSGGLSKQGAGTLVLTGAGSYAGGTRITQGTLQIGATGGAGTSGAPAPGEIGLNPATGSATLTILRGDPLNIAGPITSSGAGTHAVVIGLAGANSPSGTVTFSGDNTFTGNVTIAGGALRITHSGALGLGPKTVSIASNAGPSLQLDGSTGDLNLPAGINFTASSEGTIANAAANSGALVNLAGNNTINGRIALINGGGGQGRITVQSGSLTLNGGIDATGATGARSLLLGGAAQGTVHGVVADTGTNVVSVSKDGAGIWTLTGANTFTGAVAVNAGTLRVSSFSANGIAQPLGAGAAAVTVGTATTTGTLEYIGTADATLSRPVTVNGLAGGIVRNSGGATLTIAGTLAKNGRPLTLAGGAFQVTGAINGANAGDLILDRATATLHNPASSFLGDTRVGGGSTLRNGAGEVLPNTTTLILGDAAGNTGGTYDLNGFNEIVGGLGSAGTGAKVITNGAASGFSFLAVSGGGLFDGSIQDGPNAIVGFAKTGTGVLQLSGASEYSGPTEISGGTLLVSGSLAGSAVTVQPGGTLGGSGTIDTHDQPLTVAAGGKLAPGVGLGVLTLETGTAELDLSGAFTALASGALIFELGTPAASDRLELATGAVQLGSGVLDFGDFSFSALTGFGPGVYTLIASGRSLLGQLDADAEHLRGFIGGYPAELAFADNQTDLALIVSVPEPSSALALLGGAALLLGLTRRRRLQPLVRVGV